MTNKKILPTVFLLLILMAAGTVIRILGVNEYHYHADEIMHINIAKASSFGEMLHFSLLETHPPLGHILRYYWLAVTDSDNAAVQRGFSLVFGIALIPLYYAIGKVANDRLTGICAAVLVTFSHGLVIQSYVVRNYSIFVFFLSLAFYYYLLWHRDRAAKKPLVLYALFSALAVLTHFAGIFALFSLLVWEIRYIGCERHGGKYYIRFLLANTIPVLLLGMTFFLWHSAMAPVQKVAEAYSGHPDLEDMLAIAPLYIVHVFRYDFINPDSIFLLALLPVAIALKHKALNDCLARAGGMLLLGVVLFLTGIYPFAGDRHGLWLLPFLILPAGWMMADISRIILKKEGVAAIAVTVAALLCYNPQDKFRFSDEYRMKEQEWQQVKNWLNHLDNKSLLVTGRTDAIMLSDNRQNIYRHINLDGLQNFAYIPYYNTHILFNNQGEMRIYTSTTLKRMMQGADSNSLLNSYETLVFVNSYMSSEAMVKLINCTGLPKKMVAFANDSENHDFNPATAEKYQMVFVIVSRKDFMEQLMPPSGQAASCIEDKSR